MDTNVLYQALRSNKGASHFILQLIRNRKIRLALSIPVFTEYNDVLYRNASLDDLNFDKSDIEKILIFISYISIPYNISFIFKPNLKDENDNKFIELAVVSNASFLITNNIKDFYYDKNLKFPEINIVTPAEFVRKWRNQYEK
ncbi:MAG: putative toxin-antitoxin system toxin component, PIN family [Spirochaetia bacterium]|nr:putative toxin-antitoxin system toxin component, PIN family [Spirochaetia bacterium]